VPVCVRPSASGWTRGVDELCGHVTAASVLSDTRDEPACLTNIELQSFTKWRIARRHRPTKPRPALPAARPGGPRDHPRRRV